MWCRQPFWVAKSVAFRTAKNKMELHLFLAICVGISLKLARSLTVNDDILGRQLCSCLPVCNLSRTHHPFSTCTMELLKNTARLHIDNCRFTAVDIIICTRSVCRVASLWAPHLAFCCSLLSCTTNDEKVGMDLGMRLNWSDNYFRHWIMVSLFWYVTMVVRFTGVAKTLALEVMLTYNQRPQVLWL